jgi:integrase
MKPYINDVLEFLTHLFESGIGYSAINTARSALSTFIFINNRPVGEHPLVTRLLRGVFNKRPVFPKHTSTWDPHILLDYLKSMSPVKKLSFLALSKKCLALLWVLSGQRGQTLKLIDVRNIKLTKNHLEISFGDLLKTSRPNFHQKPITLKAYAPDRRLCIVTTITEYIRQRNQIAPQVCTQLFITSQKPHGPLSKNSMSRWVKDVMKSAGIDTQKFTPHSIRSASTSLAKRVQTPIDTILSTAGWTKASTFQKYYDKPLLKQNYNVMEMP